MQLLRLCLAGWLFWGGVCAAQVAPSPAPNLRPVTTAGAPEYPRASLRYLEEGDVVLRIAVNAAGEVNILSIERSSGFGRLDLSAIAYARTLKGEPARNSAGEPVAGEFRLPLSFRIEGLPTRSPDELGSIGVRVDRLPPESAEAFAVPGTAAVIREVRTGSPAARAGLEVGDIVLAANDWAVQSPTGLIQAVQASRPGGSIVLTVFRKFRIFRVTVPVDLLVR